MSAGVFVTGTDTGVGKTLVSCAIVHALRARGIGVAPMKPVAAGAIAHGGGWINEDTLALLEAAGLDASEAGRVTPVLLREPIAPHIAAEREGRRIDLAMLVSAFESLRATSPFVLVEGVGGFRVPLDGLLDTADLAAAFALPVVMVVGMRLGCLNHALLTAESIDAAGLRLAGWVANAIDPSMAEADANVAALRSRLAAPLLGRLPFDPAGDAAGRAALLDPGPLL